jgi:transposase
MKTLHRRVAGIDVHRMCQVATILIEQEDGSTEQHSREVGGFKRDLRWLVAWLKRYRVELVVMESTGIYWKSLYAHLERAGIETWVVNAHHIKHVPGRKTDMADSHWLAELGRFGLVRPSFIPPQDLRELRMISRYRKKLSGILAGEKNRLHNGVRPEFAGRRKSRHVGGLSGPECSERRPIGIFRPRNERRRIRSHVTRPFILPFPSINT